MTAQDVDGQPGGGASPDGSGPAEFVSILDATGGPLQHGGASVEGAFRDLNLDRIVAAALAGREQYDLAPFFAAPMVDAGTAAWRHAVFHDLERPALRAAVEQFAAGMARCREALAVADKLYYALQKQFWHHEAARHYCETLRALACDLDAAAPQSPGFRALGRHVAALAGAYDFRVLEDEIAAIGSALLDIRYETVVHGDRVTVRRYDGAEDYSAAVERMFDKFKLGAVRDYRVKFPENRQMDHVEAAVLDLVARLFPDAFARLAAFARDHADFIAPSIARFEREIQFCLCWLALTERARSAGLSFCYPQLSPDDHAEDSRDGYDLGLALKLIAEGKPAVTNDYALSGAERIIVVSGPNQGGKTTFARAFGQLHYFAGLGLPVPGSAARLLLVDAVHTHFEREEDLSNLRGKLEDDLVRIHDILGRTTARSVVVLNEIFNSTTLDDQVLLSTRVLGRVMESGALCTCVSFIDELASIGAATFSMVSTVVPDRPAERTFKVVRRKANGLAYAMSLAEKHGLTTARLNERLSA